MAKEIYLIPYAHLDTQWRWEYPTTISIYLKRTLEENFKLLQRYPEYCFNFTGALRYSMMKEYYPEAFEQLKTFVQEGRWNIAGTCLDETDSLLPSTESQIRNILYGHRWALNEFGKSSRDYMLPDCFGFPANMPTVLAHCNINGFSTQKLSWNSAEGIPFEVGIWVGPDGSELPSAFNPSNYTSKIKGKVQSVKSRTERLKKLGMSTGVWKSLQYYGVGDIGGAPHEKSVVQAINSIQDEDEEISVRQGAPEFFFDELTSGERGSLARYHGDLLLINHSAGVLTSAAIMKRWNRKNEQLAFAAEAAAASAFQIAGSRYPVEKIESAWKRVIGSQMHDILPGTSTPNAYEYSQNDEVVALNTWSSVIEDSASAIAAELKGDGDILLFNPCPEDRKDPVDLELPPFLQYSETGRGFVMVDSEGNRYPCQVRKGDAGKSLVTFIPELPSLGWKRFSLVPFDDSDETDLVLKTNPDAYTLENRRLCIRISADGVFESLFDKDLNREMLRKPVAYEFQKEKPKMFPAWNMDWKDRQKPPFKRIEGGEFTIIEEGPLRCTLRITTSHGRSDFIRDLSLSAGSGQVDLVERINWKETGCSLKLSVASTLDKPQATFNWESSRVVREVNKEKSFEMPSRYWADLSESDSFGISILEDSKYGYDHPSDDTLRLTLLYTPGLAKPLFMDQKSQDWGEHTIRYALYPHGGDWKGTDVQARLFNQRVRPFQIDGELPAGEMDGFSILRSSSKQIGIQAVKKSEDGDELVVRIYERHGLPVRGFLEFPETVISAQEVNGLEEMVCEVVPDKTRIPVELKANGISSYRVEFTANSPAATKQKKTKQEALKLPMNTKLFAGRGEPGNGGRGGGLFPRELVPGEIDAGPIRYLLEYDTEIDSRDSYDSMTCKGQTLNLPAGHSRIYLLAAADEACDAGVSWLTSDGETLPGEIVTVPPISGFRGQWDIRIWKRKPGHLARGKRDYIWNNRCVGVEPGYIHRDRLEWYSTHTRINGEDRPYEYGYMYSVILDIPENATGFVLPQDERVIIFAATVAGERGRAEFSGVLNDKYDF